MIIFFNFFRQLNLIRNRLRYSDTGIIIVLTILLVLLGTVGYALIEGWTWLDALYATIITMTTVGYGDLSPSTQLGRIFAVGFTLVAIGIGGYAISTFAAIMIERQAGKLARKQRRRRMRKIDEMSDHIIIVGSTLVSRQIALELNRTNVPFVIVDNNPDQLKEQLTLLYPGYLEQLLSSIYDLNDLDIDHINDMSLTQLADKIGVTFIIDDPLDDMALVRAGIERARGIITVLEDDRDNLAVIIGARAVAQRFENNKLRIMTQANASSFIRKMYLAGADNVRIPQMVGGFEMASHIMNPDMGNWWYAMVQGRESLRFTDERIEEGNTLAGKTVEQLRAEDRQLVLAIQRNEEYISMPSGDTAILPGDIIIRLQENPNS